VRHENSSKRGDGRRGAPLPGDVEIHIVTLLVLHGARVARRGGVAMRLGRRETVRAVLRRRRDELRKRFSSLGFGVLWWLRRERPGELVQHVGNKSRSEHQDNI
jgi:hypothetical protein